MGFKYADEIIHYRYGGDYSKFGGIKPQAVDGTFLSGEAGKWTARGMEQKIFQEWVNELGVWDDMIMNLQNPVGPNNARIDDYMDAAQCIYNHVTR